MVHLWFEIQKFHVSNRTVNPEIFRLITPAQFRMEISRNLGQRGIGNRNRMEQ